MLPLDTNPWSWTYGACFTLACFCFYRLPTENRVKGALRKLAELESHVLASSLGLPVAFCERRADQRTQAMSLVLSLVLFAFSLASFVHWLGL